MVKQKRKIDWLIVLAAIMWTVIFIILASSCVVRDVDYGDVDAIERVERAEVVAVDVTATHIETWQRNIQCHSPKKITFSFVKGEDGLLFLRNREEMKCEIDVDDGISVRLVCEDIVNTPYYNYFEKYIVVLHELSSSDNGFVHWHVNGFQHFECLRTYDNDEYVITRKKD